MSLSQPSRAVAGTPETGTTLQARCPETAPAGAPSPELEHKQNWRQRMSEPVPLREAMQAFWAERNAMIVAADRARSRARAQA